MLAVVVVVVACVWGLASAVECAIPVDVRWHRLRIVRVRDFIVRCSCVHCEQRLQWLEQKRRGTKNNTAEGDTV